jgi:RHS repeat-associated protein
MNNGLKSKFKSEEVLSQSIRSRLPDPAQFGLSRANTYFVVAMEFLLTPNNINVFARRPNGKTPIKQGNNFGFDGDDPIDFEDADSTLHFFFPKDYAYAMADSVTDFSNRVSMRRYFYSDHDKDYMLVGVPWNWIDSAPEGDLIIDPTTNAAASVDVRIYDTANYGSDTKLAVGKFPNANNYKARTLIKFDLSGIPSGATVLRSTMNLRYYEAVNYGGGTWVDRWMQVHELLLLNFEEQSATRDDRTIDIPWYAQYAAIDGTDAKATMESTLLFWQSELSELPKWKGWDLTALTQKWMATPASNYGVILWATNEDVAGYTMRFYSSEATNQSDRPYLEVVYSTEATTRTVYFLKDHLGSIRATVLDSTGAPVIGYDDYDPWGYALALRTKPIPNAYLQGASKNKFIGLQLDDEYGLNWLHTPFRSYDGLMSRWMVMDPLAEKYPNLAPYVYATNNPMRFIDQNGKEWYEINGAWQYYKDTPTMEIATGEKDKNGKEIKKTVTGLKTLLVFNGEKLYWLQEKGTIQSWTAVSGVLDKEGKTQPDLQWKENEGPIPEGWYEADPKQTQNWSDLSLAEKAASLLRGIGIKAGPWPGGTVAWGEHRVPLSPSEVGNRRNFFIHGGDFPGSVGCIDLCKQNDLFFKVFAPYSAPLKLQAKYGRP